MKKAKQEREEELVCYPPTDLDSGSEADEEKEEEVVVEDKNMNKNEVGAETEDEGEGYQYLTPNDKEKYSKLFDFLSASADLTSTDASSYAYSMVTHSIASVKKLKARMAYSGVDYLKDELSICPIDARTIFDMTLAP